MILDENPARRFHRLVPIAELHGKVPSEICSLEDTLTSGAFGLLTVLPPSHLHDWFAHARRLDGARLQMPPPISIDATFWPQLEDAGGKTCEPDALLTFTGITGERVGLLVEVKYKSDMSGWPTPVDDGQIRGQLGREWTALQIGAHAFPHRPDLRVLVYVTPAAKFPRATFEVVASELRSKTGDDSQFREGAYWVSWFALADVVREALDGPLAHVERTGLLRVHELLQARRLCAFSGMAAPAPQTAVPWSYTSTSPRRTAYPADVAPILAIPWSYATGSEARR